MLHRAGRPEHRPGRQPPHPAIIHRVPLLECVPNVSEGRRSEVVERLAAAAGGAPGAQLLDVSSDPDHDRTVLTLAGEPEPLHRALVALAGAAVAAIDLNRQRGVHPRLGALDVVPFVPLGGASMADAVAAARRLAAALAERHGLPAFLYEEAASQPERRNLAAVRRGGFERLAERMAQQPGWRPDFGPGRPHPTAGAVAVGARFFLVAYNVILDRDDPAAARRIAARVREAGGGLPAVKALGFRLASRGCAEVSLNLTDYRRTDMATAGDRVRHEAAREGVGVDGCELVGLAPRAAFGGRPPAELGLPESAAEQVLERRLAAAGLSARLV